MSDKRFHASDIGDCCDAPPEVEPLTHAEFRAMWERMNTVQKDAVRDKAIWERMGLWAVLNEWPSLRISDD